MLEATALREDNRQRENVRAKPGRFRTLNTHSCHLRGRVLSDDFDMYCELLGLPPGERPPDYYTLLGVTPDEQDAARVHAAAKRRITRLSSLLHGDRAKFRSI